MLLAEIFQDFLHGADTCLWEESIDAADDLLDNAIGTGGPSGQENPGFLNGLWE